MALFACNLLSPIMADNDLDPQLPKHSIQICAKFLVYNKTSGKKRNAWKKIDTKTKDFSIDITARKKAGLCFSMSHLIQR